MYKLTVLYAEDEPLIHCLVAKYLAARVESLYAVRDGEAGVNAFIASRPDLVIADVAMPRLDGLQMAARIRAIQPDIPFVFLTSSPERAVAFAGFDPAKDRILTKPVDLWVIGDLLKDYAENPAFARLTPRCAVAA